MAVILAVVAGALAMRILAPGDDAPPAAQPQPTPVLSNAARYAQDLTTLGVVSDVPADELESVAANTCDNDEYEMRDFVWGMARISKEQELRDSLIARYALVRVWCPAASITFVTGIDLAVKGQGAVIQNYVDGRLGSG